MTTDRQQFHKKCPISKVYQLPWLPVNKDSFNFVIFWKYSLRSLIHMRYRTIRSEHKPFLADKMCLFSRNPPKWWGCYAFPWIPSESCIVPQCYHIFSNSRDVYGYLPKNHYEPSSPKMVPISKIWGPGSWPIRSGVRGHPTLPAVRPSVDSPSESVPYLIPCKVPPASVRAPGGKTWN